MTINDAIKEFLLEQASRGNSRKTVKDYRTKLMFFLNFTGDIDVNDITVSLCRRYHLSLCERISNTVSVQTYVRSLRAFLKWLFVEEYIDYDICYKFKLPKARKPTIIPLTNAEIHDIFNVIEGDTILHLRNQLIIALMLDCGLRLNEVVDIRLDKLFREERCLVVTGKGDKQRAIAYGLHTESLLNRYLALRNSPSNLLLIKVSGDEIGEPITENTIKDLFRRLKVRSGVSRLYPHLLRHTFATRYIENGGNIFSLQLLLGHTSLNMVKRYVHLANSKVRREFVNFSPLDRLDD